MLLFKEGRHRNLGSGRGILGTYQIKIRLRRGSDKITPHDSQRQESQAFPACLGFFLLQKITTTEKDNNSNENIELK